MTDNEKRAHDLAICALPHAMKACKWEFYSFTNDGAGQSNFDIVPMYHELYNEFLAEIKEEF